MADDNFYAHRREQLRADILVILNRARPTGAMERLVRLTLGDQYSSVGPAEMRREAVYLEEKSLLGIERRRGDNWHLRLTPDGVDVVEGVLDTPVGIADMTS